MAGSAFRLECRGAPHVRPIPGERAVITAKVYRAEHGRDAHGDPLDADGKVARNGPLLGELEVIPGWLSTTTVYGARGEVADTQGLVGARRDAAIKLQHGDRLVMSGATFQISGPRLFDSDALTGEALSHYWIQASVTTN